MTVRLKLKITIKAAMASFFAIIVSLVRIGSLIL